MDKMEITSGLGSGRLHPHPLLMHLNRQGNEELGRFVALEGPKYISGTERLKFRNLVGELYPEDLC